MLFDSRAQREKILDTFSLVLHLKTPFLKGFLSKILKIFRCAARVPPYAKKSLIRKPPCSKIAANKGGVLIGKNLKMMTQELELI